MKKFLLGSIFVSGVALTSFLTGFVAGVYGLNLHLRDQDEK